MEAKKLSMILRILVQIHRDRGEPHLHFSEVFAVVHIHKMRTGVSKETFFECKVGLDMYSNLCIREKVVKFLRALCVNDFHTESSCCLKVCPFKNLSAIVSHLSIFSYFIQTKRMSQMKAQMITVQKLYLIHKYVSICTDTFTQFSINFSLGFVIFEESCLCCWK